MMRRHDEDDDGSNQQENQTSLEPECFGGQVAEVLVEMGWTQSPTSLRSGNPVLSWFRQRLDGLASSAMQTSH